jgi:transcriptional regulator with XRE-family HTH domain
MSRAQLAEAVGVKPDVVGLWEGRGVTPAAHHLPKAAAAVGLDVFDLYSPPKGVDGLSALRMRAGLSQRRLAQLMGIPQTTLSGWERGASRLPEGKTSRYAQALGVSVDEILTAANAVRPDSPSAGPVRAREPVAPSRTAVLDAARPAHLIHVHEDAIVDMEPVGGSQLSRVYSPQGVDVRIAEAGSTEALIEEAVSQLRISGIRTWCSHHEYRMTIDGVLAFVLRYQGAPSDEARTALAHRLVPLLAVRAKAEQDGLLGEFPIPELADIVPKLPGLSPDGAPLIVAMPYDRWDWLRDQMEPYAPYRFVFRDPQKGVLRFQGVTRDHGSIKQGAVQAKLGELGITGETTIIEASEKLLAYEPGM